MLLCCRPKLNWMPKKPTFMFTICQNESWGLGMVMSIPSGGGLRQPAGAPRFIKSHVGRNGATNGADCRRKTVGAFEHGGKRPAADAAEQENRREGIARADRVGHAAP